MNCFYCEKKEATKWRFEEPCCNDCYMSYLVDQIETQKNKLTEREMAERYKVLLNSFLTF